MTSPADDDVDQDAMAAEWEAAAGDGDEQDDLAAEWESMVGDEGEDGEGEERLMWSRLWHPGLEQPSGDGSHS